MLGDGSYNSSPTKVNNMLDIIRHTKGGRIVYGDNMSNTPFAMNGDTNTQITTNSQFVCTKQEPIINGLRGGIVPPALRKNKF